jgi:hypothetical protein
VSGSLSLAFVSGSLRDDLTRVGSGYFHLLLFCTAIVAVGVIMEEADSFLPPGKPKLDLINGTLIPSRSIEWKKRLTRLGWLLIVIGVIGEGIFEGAVSWADGVRQNFDDTLLAVATDQAGTASKSAERANTLAASAKKESEESRALANGARKEADSFEKDIKSAKNDAAEAESHLAAAARRANDLTAQLKRLTTPRSLPASPQVVAALQQFEGTEYMFTGVCGDTECVGLLRDIDKVLSLAKWKRVRSPHTFPGLILWGKREDDDGAGFDFGPGVTVSVDSPKPAEEVNKSPYASLPAYLRAADLLNKTLAKNVSPPENTGRMVGGQIVVRISVGRKPVP